MIYLAILLLMLAVPVWAGSDKYIALNGEQIIMRIENYDECEHGKVSCKVWANPSFVTIANENHCLAKMEAAMRSMDKFVVAIYRGWVIGLNPPKAKAGDLSDAYDQWTAARQCWRTP